MAEQENKSTCPKTGENADNDQGEKITVSVRTAKQTESIETTVITSVKQFKELVSTKFNTEVQKLCLIYAGKIMKDEENLAANHVKNGATILLVIKTLHPPTDPPNHPPPGVIPDTDTSQGSIFSNPLMQALMNNPINASSSLFGGEQMQNLMETNPELNHIFNNPEMLRQAMEVSTNPAMRQEYLRMQDRVMSNIESLPGGFAALQRTYENIAEPMFDAYDANPFSSLVNGNINNPEQENTQQGTENRAPLPNPWPSQRNSYGSLFNRQPQDLRNQLPSPNSEEIGHIFQMLQNPDLLRIINNPDVLNESIQLQQAVETLNRESGGAFEELGLFPDAQGRNAGELLRSPEETLVRLRGLMESNPLLADAIQNVQNRMDSVRDTLPDLYSFLGLNNLADSLPDVSGETETRTSANVLPPEQRYQIQLEQLMGMGFSNRGAVLQALVSSSGDVGMAIEILLTE